MGKTLGYGEITVANMTEPFTVMLTNEAQQFATDSNRKVTSAQSYYTDIIVIRGSQERTDYTIGNITSSSGITVSKNNKRVTFSVSAGATIGADTGVIEIPITLDGQTVKKQFSWSCGKQGPQGAAGQDGSNFAWNLIKYGKGDVKKGFFKDFNKVENGYGELTLTSKKSYQGLYISDGFVVPVRNYPVGSKLIWSYDIMYTKWDFPAGTNHQEFWLGQRYTSAPSGETATGQWTSVTLHQLPVVGRNGCELNKWLHVEAKVVVPKKASDNVGTENRFQFYNSGNDTATVTLRMKNVKLEYGDTATPWSPAQSDLKGRGVSQTVQYYLATSQASGVTSSTSGWSTDITTQKLTAAKKYLWNCYQTKYSDGTSEPISTPKVIGVYGDKGNGIVASVQRPNKTEFWWSQVGAVGHKDTFDDSSNTRNNCRVGDIFTVMGTSTEGNSHTAYYKSTTDSGDLAGECINHVVAESGADAKNLSITPSSQYFKSTDGGKTFAPDTITIKPTIQGEINFGKWQYSIDGGVSFADVVSGQTGLTISNNVLTVSKDSSLYSDAVTMVTFRAVANDSNFYDTCSIAKIYDVSDIGDGRNLLTGVSSYTKDTPFEKTDSRADGWIVYQNIITSIELEAGKKYVLQVKTDGNWAADHNTNGQDPSKKLVTLWLVSDKTNDYFDMRQGYAIFTPTVTTKYKLRVNQYSNGTDAYTIHLWDIKLEKGSSPTGWTPAPEDVQTAILSTKSEISDVSLKVDNNKQAIEQRVEKTTYERELTLVKGDISKANEGLNKWRYEIYPKSLFADKPEDQSKYDIGVFIRNKNLTPSRTLVFDDNKWTLLDYENNYIGYGLTFVKMSAKKTFSTKWAHSSSCSIYVNGKLIISDEGTVRLDSNNTGRDFSCTFIEGWNCIEFVMQETTGNEWFFFKDAISALSECQLMNCYYGTPVARQSHITNQLVKNTTDIDGVSGSVQTVMSTVGGSDKIDEFVNNYSTWKKKVNGIETRVGETYTTKSDFNGLEIGGRNLVLDSKPQKQGSSYTVVSRHLSVDLQADVTYTISFCGRVVDGDGSLVVYLYRNDWKDSIQKSTKSKENTVISWQFTPKISGAFQIEAYSFLSQGVAGGNVYLDWFKVEKGNKATDWTPAPEDNEINGQNLVSNLPSNWEQGSFQDSKTNVGCDYDTNKVSMTTRIRVKELVPVSGNITISNAYSNQSKKPILHWITAFDVNKKWLGASYVSTAWSAFPRTVDMKDAKYIAVIVGYEDGSAITPSDISQICLKIERGTSATAFTLAPEDVNGKIVNVETIANQTAKKFEWIVKGGDKSSSMVLTDDFLNIVANKINLTGKVTFNSLSSDAKNEIGKVAQSKVDGLEVGGRNLARGTSNEYSTAYTNFKGSINTCFYDKRVYLDGLKAGDTITVHMYVKYDDIVPTSGQTARMWIQGSGNVTGWNSGTFPGSSRQSLSGSSVCEILYSATVYKDSEKNQYWDCCIRTDYIQSGSMQIKSFKVEKGNKATDWTPAPEDYLPQASLVSNWTTNTTWIDGGKIYTGSITANKIAANTITADKIATDAIKSRNYISSGGTQGSFLNLSDGSFISPNLSWDSNGNLIAKNANLSGQITATKGSIGGWSVDNYSIYTTYDADQNIFGSGISGTKGKYVLWAGETNNAIGANRSSDTPTDASLVIYNNGGLEVRKTMVGNDKKNHLYTTILQSGQINLKMDDNYIGTITATDTISSNSTVTMSHVSMAAKKGYGWSILHTDDSGNLISDIQRDPSDTKIKINSPITVSSTDISKYNAIETTGDVVVSGKIHANYGSNKIQLNPDNNGSIELYGYTPFIDFHYGNSDSDYTSRIIAQEWGLQIVGTATVTGDLYCDAHIYTCTNGHFSWAGQTDAYLGCGNYSGGNNIYYYANYHAFYVNNDSGSGMMYINTNGVTSRVGFTKTSDERIKKNFESFDDNIIDAYMNIEPVKYQLKQSSNDNYHFGFKAQHVDKVFSDYGDTYNESFDICTSRPIDPDKAKELYGVDDMTEEYGLRYDELIAPTTYMVQHIYKELESTKGELAKVKQEKADLETRLQAIEAKLGL